MRKQGFRRIQVWVPDSRATGFVDEAHRQAPAIAASNATTDDQKFIAASSVSWDDK